MKPREYLINASRQWPGIWRLVDVLRQQRNADDPRWPEYVFLPLEKAGAAMAQWYAANDPHQLHPSTLVGPSSELAGLDAWRITQGVYRFDPALYGGLVDTPITGQIPGELLTRLPEWCVYIETPDMSAPLMGGGSTPLHGVWSWLDHTQDGDDILTVMMNVEGMDRLPVGHIPLVGTLDDALARVEADWRDAIQRGNADGFPASGYAEAAKKTFAPILSLLLYLCAEEADISGQLSNPKPKRTKQGWRLFPADKPTTWEVGERIGAALRLAYHQAETEQREIDSDTGRARPRAHIRRAHWHKFLVGKDRSECRVKWLPPLPINMGNIENMPTTVRPVK